jgi:hypothetical protein
LDIVHKSLLGRDPPKKVVNTESMKEKEGVRVVAIESGRKSKLRVLGQEVEKVGSAATR